MNTNNQNSSEFSDKKEALEFLLQEKADREKKAEWAKTLPGNPRSKTKVIFLRKRIIGLSAVAASIALICFFVFGNNNQMPEYQSYASNLVSQLELDSGSNTRGSGSDIEDGSKELEVALEEKDEQKVLQLYKTGGFALSNRDKFNYSLLLAKQKNQENELILNLTRDLIDSKNEYTADALLLSAEANINLNKIDEAKADLNIAKAYNYKIKEIENLLQLLTTPK